MHLQAFGYITDSIGFTYSHRLNKFLLLKRKNEHERAAKSKKLGRKTSELCIVREYFSSSVQKGFNHFQLNFFM